MDMKTVKIQVMETMHKEGHYAPAIIVETTVDAGIIPVPDIPASSQERLLLFYRVGRNLATLNKGELLDVTFVSEIQLNRQVGRRAIRREILAIDRATQAPGHTHHEIACYDIAREAQGATLSEIHGPAVSPYGPLLDMFIAGFNGEPLL